MGIEITLAPLVLGLTAWVLAVAGFRKKQLGYFSWVACAAALWFPLLSIHNWVIKEDISAIMDCAKAYMICAGVLLAVNAVLNALPLLKKK